MTKILPYGTWSSPVTSELIVAKSVGLAAPVCDSDAAYWLETRPEEQGRCALVRQPFGGTAVDLIPAPYNVRTRVHEYGGGAFILAAGRVYFSNFTDQRIHSRAPDGSIRPITPEGPFRYADYCLDRERARLICVCEMQRTPDVEPTNSLVTVALDGGEPQVIESGADFYAAPRVSRDGRQLAWIAWYHPQMPWDGTELWVADVAASGGLVNARCVAGGPRVAVVDPQWTAAGELYFLDDRTGFWNLYRWYQGQVDPLVELAADFAGPMWTLGDSHYAFTPDGRLLCTYKQNGSGRLAWLDPHSRTLAPIDSEYQAFGSLRVYGQRAVFIGGAPDRFSAVVTLDLTTGRSQPMKAASDMVLDPGDLSVPDAIEYPSAQGRHAHAFFYAPRNAAVRAPADERPPLIVMSHGGPTAATEPTLKLPIQYWTSRGFAVLDVNYGGSTGYGRAYRDALRGQWGVVDVEDCVHGALYLAERGLVDRERLAIRGGSAGGYTTLCALCFHSVFKAGASHYGVSDLEALAQDTHKFESRYLDSLVGPYPARRDRYVQRSPLHAADRLNCPVIFFQGLEDRIVPPNQAEKMVAALRAKGIPVAYLTFAGEQHGFRSAAAIKRVLDAELYFYARVFGFEPPAGVEPVAIENL